MHQNNKVKKQPDSSETQRLKDKKKKKNNQNTTECSPTVFQTKPAGWKITGLHLMRHNLSPIVPTNSRNSPHVPLVLRPLPPPAEDGTSVTWASKRQRQSKNHRGPGADRNTCQFHLGSGEQAALDRREPCSSTQWGEREREERRRERGGRRRARSLRQSDRPEEKGERVTWPVASCNRGVTVDRLSWEDRPGTRTS